MVRRRGRCARITLDGAFYKYVIAFIGGMICGYDEVILFLTAFETGGVV
jgi:hypothetical protein